MSKCTYKCQKGYRLIDEEVCPWCETHDQSWNFFDTLPPPSKPKHIHDYQYVGTVDDVLEGQGGVLKAIEQSYRFVCPISGCSKPVKVVKEK